MYPNSNYQQNVVNGSLPPPQLQQSFQQQPQHQPMNPSGINKYMPPPPQQQPQGSFSPIPPSTNANFPPHMRQQNLQNGTSGSNASSRTASPLPPMQQQHQVNRPPINGNQLTGNMQNMSLGPPQGSPRPVQPYPPVQNGLPQSAPLPPSASAAHLPPNNSTLPPQNFQAGLGLHGMNKNTPSIPGMPHMPPQNAAYLPNKPPQQPPPLNQQNVLNNNAYQQQSTQPLRSLVPGPIPPYQPQTQAPQQQQPLPQRNPMYPNVVQQPPPPAFNGIPNPAPMQYQMQQQQQPQFGQQQQQQQYGQPQQPSQMGVTQQGFNRLWGQDTVDLMQSRHILSPASLATPKINLNHAFHESVNCNPDVMRCTVAKIPESKSLLDKSRLPLGLVVHPFRDINSLPVIQCPNIVRCRLCRTYINPFVYFTDTKTWKCNLCYRVNELPEDFQFDPATKTYGDVTRRPEVRSSTIEFIAPSEYMLRPPQPAIYLFLFDVSLIAQQSGYLENVCSLLSKHLDDMPGDARTQVGFIAFNSELHFYGISEGYNQPHEMTVTDIEDPFLPCPENLLINLEECKELIKDLLNQLPKRFANSHDPGSALGAALQVAYKMMMSTGGRVTVFQTCLPTKGMGALTSREDPNNRSGKEVAHLNPATDFYKRHALECSGYQIAVDLFLLNQQYSDMATLSGVSKHSGGCVHHFPLYQKTKPDMVDAFRRCLRRYLTRKIGFEAVMRIRCTRGLQVHTFHGNFFVRSTDLLSLPNVNPDAGYGMQISYDETLTDVKTICFQAALLYTNSEGERRIRVHTLCLPVSTSLSDILHSADSVAIVGLLSKMAVDRSLSSNMSDARDAFINATIDILSAFRVAQNLPSGQTGQLMAPMNLAMLPLYILALLKHTAFRVGTSTRLDDRVNAMDLMKTLPLDQLIKYIYPEFYNIDCLFTKQAPPNDEDPYVAPNRLQLSAEFLDSRSMFLLDSGNLVIIYVGLNVPSHILKNSLGVSATAELPDYKYELAELKTPENENLWKFITDLNEDKPYDPTIQIIRDTSTARSTFYEKLIDDRNEASLSYYEFLQHLRSQVK